MDLGLVKGNKGKRNTTGLRLFFREEPTVKKLFRDVMNITFEGV